MPSRTRHFPAVVAVVLAALATTAAAQVPVSEATRTALTAPAAARFTIVAASDAARAAFESAYDDYLELNLTRAAAGFRRAWELDPELHLARAFDLTLRGRGPAVADEVQRLHTQRAAAGLIESLQFLSIRERNAGRTTPANQLLAAAARTGYDDPRLLAEYHLWLAVGNATRINIARMLRDHDPASARYQAYVALALTAPEDHEEALRAMNEALRLGGDRAFPHFAAGLLLTRLRRLDEAMQHHTHALERDPGFYLARFQRGRAALIAGRFADARRDFEEVQRAATFAPDLGLARRAAALTYLHERNIDAAVRAMEQVAATFEAENAERLRWTSQLGLAHGALAIMAGARRDAAGVEHHMRAAFATQGEDASAPHSYAAVAFALAGEPVRARAALESYAGLAGAAAAAPYLAMVLVAEGQHDAALAAAANSTNNFAHLARYQALTALGRRAEAQAALDTLLDASDYSVEIMSLPVARYLYTGR